MNYTNKLSFTRTWSVVEYDILATGKDSLQSDGRFDEACRQATEFINVYLSAGGYTLPLVFLPAGEVGAPNPLDGVLQRISDSFVAYYLAHSVDRMKKPYLDAYAEWKAFLEKLAAGGVALNLPRITNGSTEIVVLSNPKLFNRGVPNVYNLFANRHGRC